MKRGEVRRPSVAMVDGVEVRIGDRVPVPPHKLIVNPASGADSPQRGPRGVFRNGTR